jgi:HK97 family phage major capsid protein
MFPGVMDAAMFKPPSILQLLTVTPVQTDLVSWARETYTSAATPVAEASALTGTSGTKPEAGATFTLIDTKISTFAAWIAATKRIVSDAVGLRAMLDSNLTEDLRVLLEDEVISGSGSGEHFTGILNTPSIGTLGPPAGGQNALDVIRAAKRKIRVDGKTTPTAVVMHPDMAELLDTLKASTAGTYLGGGPFTSGAGLGPVWGIPTVESESVPTGFALVGDFRKAVLFDRESTSISLGTANDDFIRNIVRILAELRAGFGVLRPKAFCYVDLVP